MTQFKIFAGSFLPILNSAHKIYLFIVSLCPFLENKDHNLSPSQNTEILLEMYLIVSENSIHIKGFLSHFNLKKKKKYWFYLSLIMTAYSSESLKLPLWWRSLLKCFPLRFSVNTALLPVPILCLPLSSPEEGIHRAWTPSQACLCWSCAATSPVDSEL